MKMIVYKENSNDEVILVIHSVECVPRRGETIEVEGATAAYLVSHVHYDYPKRVVSVWAE